jgi:hypothetical protein
MGTQLLTQQLEMLKQQMKQDLDSLGIGEYNNATEQV